MASITRTDANRDMLILGLRAEGVPNAHIGAVFGVCDGVPSQVGSMTRRHVHFLGHDSVDGLVEKYGNRTYLIGGIHWGKRKKREQS